MSLWSSVFGCCLVLGLVHASYVPRGDYSVEPFEIPNEFQQIVVTELKDGEDKPIKTQVRSVPLSDGGNLAIDWAGCFSFTDPTLSEAERITRNGETPLVHLLIQFGSIRYEISNPSFEHPIEPPIKARGNSALKFQYNHITAHVYLDRFLEDWDPTTNAGKGLVIMGVELDTENATECPFCISSKEQYERMLKSKPGIHLELRPTLIKIMEDGIYQIIRNYLYAANVKEAKTQAEAKTWTDEQAGADEAWNRELELIL